MQIEWLKIISEIFLVLKPRYILCTYTNSALSVNNLKMKQIITYLQIKAVFRLKIWIYLYYRCLFYVSFLYMFQIMFLIMHNNFSFKHFYFEHLPKWLSVRLVYRREVKGSTSGRVIPKIVGIKLWSVSSHVKKVNDN